MKILVFGATGMVGQGVLRECLRDPGITTVITVGRRPTGQKHDKLQEILHGDLADISQFASRFTAVDACFFCLGVSSLRMTAEQYSRITYDLTRAVAGTLVRASPKMVFVYVSGAGTDSTENGRTMWARVKGRTENALQHIGFRAAYMFRPGLIIPLHGIRSMTPWYNAAYAVMRPLKPLLLRLSPAMVTTTEQVGHAMIAVARKGYPKPILEMRDINSLSS